MPSFAHENSEKSAVRSKLQRLRAELGADELSNLSKNVLSRLLESEAVSRSENFLFFWPMEGKGEIDLRPLLNHLTQNRKRAFLPVISDLSKGVMVAKQVRNEDELLEGPYSTKEPQNGEEINAEDLDLVIVPGLAFDREGFRMGYGGGFYDRYLPKCTNALLLGVCPSLALRDRLPREEHDIAVDVVLTEYEWIESSENATGE